MGSNLWVVLGLGVAGIYVLLRRPLSGKPARDRHGAFLQYLELRPPPLRPPPAGAPASLPPPLTGLFFAVKDIFDIEGFVTGFGSPAWRSTHDPAYRTAHAVAELVKAGAVCLGKTHMDEMAYSINGENFHYGTPDNPVAPGRVPGGSSSGSAVAVAGGHVDFALGTDTGGSVRVPAAYCGVLGFRPSHGAVSTVGVVPMAQSFDTVAWFARDPLVLRAVGQVLLGPAYGDPRPPRRFLVADDLFKVPSSSQDRVLALVTKGIERVFGEGALAHTSVGDYLAATVPSLALKLQQLQRQQQRAGDGVVGLAALRAVRDALRRIQAFEFRTNHEQWLAEAQPGLGPGTAERVRAALETEADVALSDAQQVKKEVQAAITGLLKGDVVLVLPTVPGPPPRKNTKVSQLDDFRARAFTLLSLAGMSGCCQVSLPLGKLDGLPASVSFIARPGSDHFLLDTVVSLVLSRPNQWKGHSDH